MQTSNPTPANNLANGTGSTEDAASRIAGMLTDDLTIDNTPQTSNPRAQAQQSKATPNAEQPEEDSESHEVETEQTDEPHSDSNEADGDGQSDETEEDAESNSQEESDPDSVSDDTAFSIHDGDKDVTVTLAELKKGYTRQADYTRKMQALADERKNVTQESAQSRQEREQYRQGLAQVQQLLQQMTPQEPTAQEWAALQQYDPQQFLIQKEQWRDYKERMSLIANEYTALTQRQKTEYQQGLQAQLAAEGDKLNAAFPEWKDKAKAQAGKQAIRDYAYTLGYSPDEVNTTTDHRIFVLAHKAMMYDKMMGKGKPQPDAKPTTKIVRPGTNATAPNVKRSAVQDAKKQLRASGKVADAASLLEKLL